MSDRLEVIKQKSCLDEYNDGASLELIADRDYLIAEIERLRNQANGYANEYAKQKRKADALDRVLPLVRELVDRITVDFIDAHEECGCSICVPYRRLKEAIEALREKQ